MSKIQFRNIISCHGVHLITGVINGAQWQKLDLKQRLILLLSAYTASELALKEKIRLKLLSCHLAGWEKVSGHLFCYCWAFAVCLFIWQHRKKPAYNTSLVYFTVVTCFLLFLLIPQEVWMGCGGQLLTYGITPVNHVKINE